MHDSGDAGSADTPPDAHPASAAVVLCRGKSRLQRRSTAEPGQVGDGGVAGELITPPHPSGLGYLLEAPGTLDRGFVLRAACPKVPGRPADCRAYRAAA